MGREALRELMKPCGERVLSKVPNVGRGKNGRFLSAQISPFKTKYPFVV